MYKYYTVEIYDEHMDDGMALLSNSYNFVNEQNAIEFVKGESTHADGTKYYDDYVDTNGKLHHWDDENNQYELLEPSDCYYLSDDGTPLGVWIIKESFLNFNDVDSSKVNITVEK